MSCHWIGHFKINPIAVKKLFKRKSFNAEVNLTLKVNGPTEKPVDKEDIT